jgi:hypothetical protein
MIAKIGIVTAFLLLAALPVASAQTEEMGDCTGQQTEDNKGRDYCVGVCSNQDPGDRCAGVCDDGSCSYGWLIEDYIPTESSASSTSSTDETCWGVEIDGVCWGYETGCYRLVPKQTIYDPLTGSPLYTVDQKAELCFPE